MVKTVIITHVKCHDGYTAAWIFWKKYGMSSNIFYAGIHPNAPWSSYPDVRGKHVLMFDVSPTIDAYMQLVKHAKSFHVYDHHISNYRTLKDLPHVTFDLKHCGAYMAWNFLHPKKPIPLLLKYIQDHDMGWWKIPGSKMFVEALSLNFVLNFTDASFKKWDRLNNTKAINYWISIGNHYETLLQHLVQGMDNKIQLRYVENFKVGLVECDFKKPLSSYLANYIADNFQVHFAAIISGDNKQYILMRSSNPKVDLSKIANKYGSGGGHPGAASMTISGDYNKIFKYSN